MNWSVYVVLLFVVCVLILVVCVGFNDMVLLLEVIFFVGEFVVVEGIFFLEVFDVFDVY